MMPYRSDEVELQTWKPKRKNALPKINRLENEQASLYFKLKCTV